MNKLSYRIALTSLILASAVSFAKEPTNLADAKKTVIQYHDSSAYEKDIASTINQATTYLKTRITKENFKGKPAIILDIDETSLSNYDDMARLNFGGTLEEIRKDEMQGNDPAIIPTLKLYQFAKANNISVIFLTGRLENERQITEDNLKKAGFEQWDKLILRNDQYKKTSAVEYKTAMRKQLTADGYQILVNIGDQKSDLVGGYADKTYKLPNPYYFIP